MRGSEVVASLKGIVKPTLNTLSSEDKEELHKIATEGSDNITDVEAALCHDHLSKVLKSLIVATRLINRCPAPSPQTP